MEFHITSSGKYTASIQYTTNTNGIKEKHRIIGPSRSSPEDAYVDYLKLALQYHKEYSSVVEDFYKYGLITEEEFMSMIEE